MPAIAADTIVEAGQAYLLTKSYETSSQSSNGSTGSSNGNDAILEKIITVGAEGVEFEYDLPGEATPEDRARVWTLPARIFKPLRGTANLVNTSALNHRLEQWLKSAKWDRSVCGRWIFTWNAFKIECDPQSVIKTIEGFDLRSIDAQDGAIYQDESAVAPGKLIAKRPGRDGMVFEARLDLDPDKFHRAGAESDVVVGELTGNPVSFEAALADQLKDKVSGTIRIILTANDAGEVTRKVKITKIDIVHSDGSTETRQATETVERQPVSLTDT